MKTMKEPRHIRMPPFKPLALGSPRSGFALLTSVLAHFIPLAQSKRTLQDLILKNLVDVFGGYISDEVTNCFKTAGKGDDLIYNQEFRMMTGGPKWLRSDNAEQACFRKYIGVRGMGDFTLITTHPREILDCDDIVHSHVDAKKWATSQKYAGYQKFTSIRNPIGIVNSSLLSINALTSEYIQRYIPPENDTHEIREKLALFKYTNLDFFEGLLKFYKGYFDEYLEVREAYTELRWEDLLTNPAVTISALARAAGLPVDEDHAQHIWTQIGHVNLTGTHKHNLRKGGGKPGDWKNWITNQHLEIMRQYGFEPIMDALGYGPVPTLNEDDYTPFQRRVADLMNKGEVYDSFPDQDLFGFAFNKSNMDSSKFNFKSFDWKTATRVERSCFTDESLMMEAWEVADAATGRLNEMFCAVLAEESLAGEETAMAAVSRIKDAATFFAERMPKAHDAVFPQIRQLISDDFDAKRRGLPGIDGNPPRLIRSLGTINIVAYNGIYYGIPQSLGPIDLETDDLNSIKDIRKDVSYESVLKIILERK
jgi:hypothetical protein